MRESVEQGFEFAFKNLINARRDAARAGVLDLRGESEMVLSNDSFVSLRSAIRLRTPTGSTFRVQRRRLSDLPKQANGQPFSAHKRTRVA